MPNVARASRDLSATRSRSASMPKRRPTSRRSSSSGQASGRSAPSCRGDAPFSAMQPVLSPIAAIAAELGLVEHGPARAPRRARRAWPRRSSRPAPASWISVGATQATAGCASVQAHESCSSVRPWRSAIGRSSSSRARPASTQPAAPVAAVIGLAERALVGHVVVEEPAVVDDAREHAHAVALAGRQRQPPRPRLERVEDQHRPVDQVAEALEAADDVEREAVGRPGRDADRAAEARPRADPPSPPTPRATCSRRDRGCAAAARRSARPRSARGCARWPRAGRRRTRRAAQWR